MNIDKMRIYWSLELRSVGRKTSLEWRRHRLGQTQTRSVLWLCVANHWHSKMWKRSEKSDQCWRTRKVLQWLLSWVATEERWNDCRVDNKRTKLAIQVLVRYWSLNLSNNINHWSPLNGNDADANWCAICDGTNRGCSAENRELFVAAAADNMLSELLLV